LLDSQQISFTGGPKIATQAPSGRRSQAERRDQSEQALLIAAAEVIERDGVAAATFEAVGKQAGYSRALASVRFGSKDGMVRAVIDFLASRLEERIAARIGAVESPLERIIAYADAMLSEVEQDRLLRAYFVMMAGAVGHRSDTQVVFLAVHDEVRETLRAFILEGQGAGEIDPALDANIVALSIGSLQLGISVELLLDPDMDMVAMRRTVNAAILRILKAE
jgi:AcrR family transcriptional regulator